MTPSCLSSRTTSSADRRRSPEMIGALLTFALLVALGFSGRRAWRRVRLRRAMLALPGARPENAIVVSDFDEIDREVRRRRCPCGGRYSVRGESSREHKGRRLRVLGIECGFCEQRMRLHFDISGLFH